MVRKPASMIFIGHDNVVELSFDWLIIHGSANEAFSTVFDKGWEERLDRARLGIMATQFVKDVALIADKIDVSRFKIVIKATPCANLENFYSRIKAVADRNFSVSEKLSDIPAFSGHYSG